MLGERPCRDVTSTSCSRYQHHQKRSASRVFKGRRDNSCRVPRHKPRHARAQHTLHTHPPFAPALLHAASVHSSVLWHSAAYCLHTSCALRKYHSCMLAGSDTSNSNIFRTCMACVIPCGNSVRVCFVGGCNIPTGHLSDLDTRGCLSGSTTTKYVTS
jgi:hypothetical protein